MGRIVVCVNCGRRFDIDREGGSFNSTKNRYCCTKCRKQEEAINKAIQTKQNHTSSTDGSKKWYKIALGILCIISGFYAIEKYDFIVILTAFVIGLIFLFSYFKNDIQNMLLKKKILKEGIDEEVKPQLVWICKKCGATTKGSICEYCDSPREFD